MSDSKNSKGGAHLSDAHLPNVDEVKSPRQRQPGSMLMASARIEVDANFASSVVAATPPNDVQGSGSAISRGAGGRC